MRTVHRLTLTFGLMLSAGVLPAAARPADKVVSPIITGMVHLPDGRLAANIVLQVIARRDDLPDGAHIRKSVGGHLCVIRTDGQGRYRHDLSQGALTTGGTVKVRGFVISELGGGWAPLKLEFTPRRPRMRLNLRLRPGDHVEGIAIAYPGGVPLPQAVVYASVDDRFLHPVIVSKTPAGKDGRFAVRASLPPGAYTIEAVAEGYGLLDTGQAPPANRAGVRYLVVKMVRDFRFHVRVVNAEGVPLASRPITLIVVGDTSNAARPGAWARGLGTKTDASGAVTYVFHGWRLYTTVAAAYRHLTIHAKWGDQVSDRVTLDAMRQSEAEVTLRLK